MKLLKTTCKIFDTKKFHANQPSSARITATEQQKKAMHRYGATKKAMQENIQNKRKTPRKVIVPSHSSDSAQHHGVPYYG
jgi:ribosomal protein L9